MTQKEQDAVFTLQLAQTIEADKCTLNRETVDTLLLLYGRQNVEINRKNVEIERLQTLLDETTTTLNLIKLTM